MSRKITVAEDDRFGTNLMLAGVGACSIAFNVWAASQIYSGWAAFVLAAGLFFAEVAAYLCLKHILADWDNNHRVKPGIALFIFGLMVITCYYVGYRAFDMKNLEIREQNKIYARDAAAHDDRAAIHFAAAAAAIEAGNRSTEQTETARGNVERKKADDLKLKREKNKPVPVFFVMVMLTMFEGVKMFGRWSIGTPTRAIWAPERRRARKEEQKAREAEARAARMKAEGKRHLHAVTGS